MATTEQIQEDSDYELRTPVKHSAQLKEMETDSTKSVEYGINCASALDQIPSFHCYTKRSFKSVRFRIHRNI